MLPTLPHNPVIPVPQDPVPQDPVPRDSVQQGTMYQDMAHQERVTRDRVTGGEQDVLDSAQPIRVRLPDLYASSDRESSDRISGSAEPAVMNETVEHRQRQQHSRFARYLPGNRSQMVSLFTIGALLAGGTFLLAITLRGNDVSSQPQFDDTPAGWAQAVPRVEWNNQVFEQPKPITDEKLGVYQQSSYIPIVDQQLLFSTWPREMRRPRRSGPGSTVAAANRSARLAGNPMPDATDSVSPPSYPQRAYPQPERVARLTGIIETTIEKQRR